MFSICHLFRASSDISVSGCKRQRIRFCNWKHFRISETASSLWAWDLNGHAAQRVRMLGPSTLSLISIVCTFNSSTTFRCFWFENVDARLAMLASVSRSSLAFPSTALDFRSLKRPYPYCPVSLHVLGQASFLDFLPPLFTSFSTLLYFPTLHACHALCSVETHSRF
jgi:hypothetical protein